MNTQQKPRKICVIGRANMMGLGSMTADFCAAFPDSIRRIVIIDPERGQAIDLSPLPVGPEIQVIKLVDWNQQPELIVDALRGVEAVVGFETFYSDLLPTIAKTNPTGPVKTVMFPMWECSPSLVTRADLLIHLSDRDAAHYGRLSGPRIDWPASPAVHDPDRVINWPPKTFVHIAGNANHGRNSTQSVLMAAPALQGTGAKLAVYHAFPIPRSWRPMDESCIEYRGTTKTRRELLAGADCLVHPQQFEGLSLPISEAASEGVPIVALDLPQWRDWTHTVTAIPVGKKQFGIEVDVFAADPGELGALMRDMATGQVAMIKPRRPPTWECFARSLEDLLSGGPSDHPDTRGGGSTSYPKVS